MTRWSVFIIACLIGFGSAGMVEGGQTAMRWVRDAGGPGAIQWAIACASLLEAVADTPVAADGEAIVSNTQHGGGYSTQTLNNKTTAGSDRIGIVHVSNADTGGLAVSGVTWNGVSMTQIVTVTAQTPLRATLFYIVSPPTSASTIVVTWPSNLAGNSASAVAASSYTGVHQSTPIRESNSAFNNASPLSGVATVTCNLSRDGLIVDAMQLYSATTMTPASYQTTIQNVGPIGFGAWSGASWAPLQKIPAHRTRQGK